MSSGQGFRPRPGRATRACARPRTAEDRRLARMITPRTRASAGAGMDCAVRWASSGSGRARPAAARRRARCRDRVARAHSKGSGRDRRTRSALAGQEQDRHQDDAPGQDRKHRPDGDAGPRRVPVWMRGLRAGLRVAQRFLGHTVATLSASPNPNRRPAPIGTEPPAAALPSRRPPLLAALTGNAPPAIRITGYLKRPHPRHEGLRPCAKRGLRG